MANETTKYDQRLKLVIKEFAEDFLRFAFPRCWLRLDVSRPTWLDKEVFYNPPEGESGELDLVARLWVRGPVLRGEPNEEALHIEIESGDSLSSLRARMPRYFQHIEIAHRLSAVSVAVYLHVGLDGRGQDTFRVVKPGGNRLEFDWPYLGLPALDAEHYIRRKNLVAAAFSVFMRIEPGQRPRHLARLLRKIARSAESENRKRMLAEMAQKYLTLNEAETEKFQRLMTRPAFEEAEQMAVTFFEQGEEQGIRKGMEKGIEKGIRNSVLTLIDAKFGLTKEISDHIEAMSLVQLQNLLRRFIDPSNSLADLGLVETNGLPYSQDRNGASH